MSGITGVTGSNANLYLMFAQASQNAAQANLIPTSSGSESQAAIATAPSSTASPGTAAPGGGSSLQNQLVSAINTAIQNAEQSGNTSNLNSVVQNAVNQVLENNGIDPQSAAQQAQGAHGHGHHHHRGQGGGVGQNAGSGGITDAASLLAGQVAASGQLTASSSTTGSDTNSAGSSQQPSGQPNNSPANDLLAQLLGIPSSQGVSGLLLDEKL